MLDNIYYVVLYAQIDVRYSIEMGCYSRVFSIIYG